jgi:hypothetical protein
LVFRAVFSLTKIYAQPLAALSECGNEKSFIPREMGETKSDKCFRHVIHYYDYRNNALQMKGKTLLIPVFYQSSGRRMARARCPVPQSLKGAKTLT